MAHVAHSTSEMELDRTDKFDLAMFCAELLQARRERKRFFDSSLFSNSAWDILLELYLRPVDATAEEIVRALSATRATATRWLRVLSEQELIELDWRDADPGSSKVVLSSSGRQKLEAYLGACARFYHRHG